MAATAYFSPELFEFLRQLKRHNHREWFAKNKQRYQRVYVDSALHFITEFAAPLYELSPHFVADGRPTRGSLFRIYRDTRFSNDKTPYKTHCGIQFTHATGTDAHAPCFYLHIEPGGCFAAAGVWHPDSRALTRIRSAIVAQPEQWRKVRGKVALEGDTLARPPRGFDPKHPFIEDIKYKDFVSSIAFEDEQVCATKFMRDFSAACHKMLPLVEFTTKALGLKF
jgi:uncharacterized protein (TIGR02453 family)